jgi:hypothetical protein
MTVANLTNVSVEAFRDADSAELRVPKVRRGPSYFALSTRFTIQPKRKRAAVAALSECCDAISSYRRSIAMAMP